MSFGLQTYDTSGNIKLTQDKKLCRLIERVYVGAGATGSKYVDISNVTNPSFVSIPLNMDGYYRHLPPSVRFNTSTGLLEWKAIEPTNEFRFSAHGIFYQSAAAIMVFGYG